MLIVPLYIYYQLMSSKRSIKYQKSFVNLDEEYRKQALEKSSHSNSRYRAQLSQSLTKSFYSGIDTDRKLTGLHQTMKTLASSKPEITSQFTLRKHQNKKFNKLVAMISYVITSADKAINFLDISCNFQAQFASKLYFSDREALMKQLNNFSIDSPLPQKSMLSTTNTLDVKSIVLQQSLMQESKVLRQQNDRLKKQINILESELMNKQHKANINQSKSSHNFFTPQELSEYNTLLMTKSCEFDLLRGEYDFIQMQHKKIGDLLRQICKLQEIDDFLNSLREQSKWKIESFCPQYTLQEKKKFETLAQSSEIRCEELFTNIVNKMQTIDNSKEEKLVLLEELKDYKERLERMTCNFNQRFDDFARRETQIKAKQSQLSEEIIKLSQKDVYLQQKLAKIQHQLHLICNSCQVSGTTSIDQMINIISSKIGVLESQLSQTSQIAIQKGNLLEDIIKLQLQNKQLQMKVQQIQGQKHNNDIKNKAEQFNLLNQIESHKQQLQLKNKKIYVAQNFIRQLQQSYNIIQDKCKNERLEFASKSDQLKNAEIQINNYIQILKQKEDKILQLESSTKRIKQQISHLSSRKTSLTFQLAILDIKFVGNLSNDAKKAAFQIEDLKQRNNQLQRQIQAKQNQMNTNKNSYESSISTHKAKVKQYESNLSTLHQVHNNLQLILNDSRQKSNQTVKALQNLISHLKQQNQSLKQQNIENKKQIDSLKELLKNKNMMNSEKKSNDEIAQLVVQRDLFKEKLNLSIQESKQKQQNLSLLISQQSHKIQQLIHQNSEITHMKATLEKVLSQLSNNKDEMERTKNKNQIIDHQRSQLYQLQKKVDVLIAEKQSIHCHIQELQKNNNNERLCMIKKNQEEKYKQTQAYQIASQALKMKDNEIHSLKNIISQMEQSIKELQREKQSSQQSVKGLKRIIEEKMIETQASNHQSSVIITRLKKQLNLASQRCKSMEIDQILSKKSSNQTISQLQKDLAHLQQQMGYKSLLLRQRQHQISDLLSKNKKMNQIQITSNQLSSQLKVQALRIQQLEQRGDQLMNQLSQKKLIQKQKQEYESIGSSKHIIQCSINNSRNQNHFTDFGSFIQQKINDSFASIINSEGIKSQHSRNLITQEIQKQQEEDQFQDFSSSHVDEMMFSMSSHNQSVQCPIFTPCQPILGQFAPKGENEAHKNEQHRLKKTYSINVQDPVLQKMDHPYDNQQVSMATSVDGNSNR